MIFITTNFKNISKYWFTIQYNKTIINFYFLNRFGYTPFKKHLKLTRYTFSIDAIQKNFYDPYNKLSQYKSYIDTKYYQLWYNFQTILIPYWRRVVFKGKGFRMRKFKNSRKLTFNFGHSHWTKLRLRAYFVMFKRKKRQSQYFYCYSQLLFTQICQLISQLRRINKYTKRGLRLKKQPIIRRFGKISQMLSAHNY